MQKLGQERQIGRQLEPPVYPHAARLVGKREGAAEEDLAAGT